MTFNVHSILGSRVRFSFLDEHDLPCAAINPENGEEVWGGWWYPNLLTDGALNHLAAYNFEDQGDSIQNPRNYLAVGTGAGEVKRKSGAITASQTGTTVTANAAFFEAADVGREIVFANGSYAKITAFTSTTIVEVGTSQAVAAQAFEVWYVNLTALYTEVERENNAGGFAASYTISQVGNEMVALLTLTRIVTMDVNRTITNFGFFPTSAGGNVGPMELLRDGTGNPVAMSILAGRKLRVDHTYEVRLPFLAESKQFDVKEYDTANNLVSTTTYTADCTFFAIGSNYLVRLIDVFNPWKTYIGDGGSVATIQVLVSADTNSPTSAPTGSSKNYPSLYIWALDAYVDGSFTQTKRATLSESELNVTAYGFSFLSANYPGYGYKYKFTNPLTFVKAETHTLELALKVSWGRKYP